MTDRVIIDAHVNEDGEVKLDIPSDVKIAPGNYKVEFIEAEPTPEIDEAWTEEELKEALTFHPVPFDQIKFGGWEDKGIEDSQAWVEEQRHKRREARRWPNG